MFQNYFKIAYRHLFRNKSYVLINVGGLGISLACCVLAYLNWKYDADFDKMHSQAEQIFRVECIDNTVNNVHGWSPMPSSAASTLAAKECKLRPRHRNRSPEAENHTPFVP